MRQSGGPVGLHKTCWVFKSKGIRARYPPPPIVIKAGRTHAFHTHSLSFLYPPPTHPIPVIGPSLGFPMAYGRTDAGRHMFDGGVNFISAQNPHTGYQQHPPQRFSNVGIHESMRHDFVPGGYGNWSRNFSMQQYYPLPKSDKVCLVFTHTGFCSFRDRCRFRHPTPENAQVQPFLLIFIKTGHWHYKSQWTVGLGIIFTN